MRRGTPTPTPSSRRWSAPGPDGGATTLTGGFELEFGWRDGAFALDVVAPSDAVDGAAPVSAPAIDDDLFAGSVVPEATPNPRTIRFVTGPIHTGREPLVRVGGRRR